MSELEQAVIEWRDARQTIFDNQLQKITVEMWRRLSNAESRLMDLARGIDENRES